MKNRNQTLVLGEGECAAFEGRLCQVTHSVAAQELNNTILHQNMLKAAPFLPAAFVDVLFLDPPYNLDKTFQTTVFKKQSIEDYNQVLMEWVQAILHTLKPTASIYICGDWYSSSSIHAVASRHFRVKNRITWEREKGRGAQKNWKNSSEDIWFCTMSEDYYFNAEAVKLKRRVLAPYRAQDGAAKDWQEAEEGEKYRLTSPSNLWTDLTVPFWSMSENTDHPTQKPEKLLAKLILASSRPGDMVFDPFLGSGTSAVVAQKLGRNYLGIEQEKKYACYALHRLDQALQKPHIQGYSDGVFWERNSLAAQKTEKNAARK